ncbi:Threonylcarbamoyladenosine tRNA methylthiotransferase MtaB [Mesotoga infera]|uniref:Threonylcarbamoyladenosine tRNA methylthiotransferase MtaB n=1 Tax=Mesotoga infera TaxID=1236046 RepID=A0A7Z7LHB0_9BACT|nr:tRNA (N(6)-L-threonylcarbamoyladenosine(37)-C(2))-methylthiotransferase MtaB [Mesotoga infera]SSC13732.1 Threonylcarbamoyladenosine tRNA methylthiotransferase MtaB [Mesotoga infera]
MKKTVSIFTFGCKMNQYESQAMAERLQRYDVRFSEEKSDLFVLNSCTVTSEAERKLRQLFRRLLALNPDSKIVVVGCYSELAGEELKKIGAHAVLGVRAKGEIERYVSELLKDGSESVEVTRDDFLTVTSSPEGRTRAFLGIEDGCLNNCTYCRIRLARGSKIISKPIDIIKSEFVGLIENGYREIVLTGINIGYYGFETGSNLARLLRELDTVPGEWRIRLGSLDPDRIDNDLLNVIFDTKHIARHLHLSLQSGSDRVLRLMKRKYEMKDYLKAVDKVRSMDSRFSLTTDVIVGFPGEDDSDFEATLQTLATVGFLKVHVFRYSSRPDTEAASMKSQVESSLKKKRALQVASAAKESRRAYLSGHIGMTNTVLVERVHRKESVGYDEYYIPHRIAGRYDGFVDSTVVSLETHKEGSDAELYCRSVVR